MNTKTVNYYEKKAKQLVKRYENADISIIQALYLKHIPKTSTVLDIGFGSGRDLTFLKKNKFNIWGIDPTTYFIEHAKKRFFTIKSHFYKESLPNIKLNQKFNNFFDSIICIAVWMHLKKNDYTKAIKNISSLLKINGIIILSFSNGTRKISDERYFEKIDIHYLLKLFFSQGYTLIEKTNSIDVLKREELTWHTIVLKKSYTI